MTIKSLGRDDYLQNPQLLDDIESKLPPMLSMLWSNAAIGLYRYSLIDFNMWLNPQAEAMSMRIGPKDERRKSTVHKVFAAETVDDDPPSVAPKQPSPCVCCKNQCVSLQNVPNSSS